MKGLRDAPPWFYFWQGRLFSVRPPHLLSIMYLWGPGGGGLGWRRIDVYIKWRSLSAELSFQSQGEVRFFVVTVHLSLRKAYGVLQVRKPFPETAWVQTHSSNTCFELWLTVYIRLHCCRRCECPRRHAQGLVNLHNRCTNCVGGGALFLVPLVLFLFVASGYTFFETKFRTREAKEKTPGNGSFMLDLPYLLA